MDYIQEKNADPERIFKEIQNSDPSTFRVFNLEEHVTPFAKDQNHFYMFGSVVPELDPNTVKIFKLGSQQTWSRDESKPNISSGATFLATDSDTAYFLGRFGPHWSSQTFLPGVLEGVNPGNLSILSDKPSFTLITTDGEKVYWNSKLLNGITPENIEISGNEVKSSDGLFTYIDGRPEKDFIATSKFGEQISDVPSFSPATFIYNDSGEPRTLTTEYKTSDGNYLVKTETSDETHRGGVYIYDANSGELLHEADLKSQLAGYRMIATSPDERFMYAIVGLYEFGSYSKLYKIEIATGAVTDVSGVSTMNTYESLRNSSGLSSDGSKLIFTESSDNSYPACADFNRLYDTIKLLDLSEGTVTTLYQAEQSQHITEITWLPAENGFTYAIQESYYVENYVDVAPLDKKPNVPLIMNAYLAPCQNGYTNKLSYYRYLF